MKKEERINGYAFSRQWYEFVFGTTEIISPIHGSLYFWIVELNNKLQWSPTIGLSSDYAMKATGTKTYKSYKKALDDLVKWGFIQLINKSYNQYTSNQIALVLKSKASTKPSIKQDRNSATISKQEETLQMINPLNFFPENELNDLFIKFLELRSRSEGKPIPELRIEQLLNQLESKGENNVSTKIAMINQAIAGGYPAFRPIQNNKKVSTHREPDKSFNTWQ